MAEEITEIVECDILIHEATFSMIGSNTSRTICTQHLVVQEQMACNASYLVLTLWSRIKTSEISLKEANEVIAGKYTIDCGE